MKSADVVIILGGGVGKSLKPVLYTKERLEGFVKYSKKYKNTPIILSGAQNFWTKEKLKYTEAGAMEHFLRKAGFPKDLLYKEERSKDTLGNTYFAKQFIKKHTTWKKLLIVTTKGHGNRCKWLFKFILGKDYKVDCLEIPSNIIGFKNNKGREAYERFLIRIYKRIFKGITPGDDKEILKRIKGFYSKSKEAREIIQEISETKQRLLGYTDLSKVS